jgi:hypothetical protein
MSQAYLGFNGSVNEGGGLFNSTGTATLTNVNIQSNYTTGANNGKGGGIYALSGTVSLTSGCTLSGNLSTWQGGGNGICYKAIVTLNLDFGLNTIAGTDVIICEDS